MKVLLVTDYIIDDDIRLESDSISIYRINSNNIFENGMIVLDKFSSIIAQMHNKEGLFINTIFSFLQKLKSEGESLYYRQLHTKLVMRTRELLQHIDHEIYLYNASCDMIEYLDVECFEYTIFNNKNNIIKAIKHNIL